MTIPIKQKKCRRAGKIQPFGTSISYRIVKLPHFLLLQFFQSPLEHGSFLIMISKDGQINFTNLPQSDGFHRFDGNFPLCQLSAVHRLTVGTIQRVIGVKTHIEVHDGIQRDCLIGGIVNIVTLLKPVSLLGFSVALIAAADGILIIILIIALENC